MEAALASQQNSTNGRTNSQQRLLWGMRFLEALSPRLAARAAERMFFTPRHFNRPDWEQQLLAKAQRFTVRHERALLPAYTWGSGPTVLLVHGWEGRGTQMGSFVPALNAAGYRAVAIDLPGHGGASKARTSVHGFAAALTSVLPQLGPVAAIVGHSAGAAASALAYTMAPFDTRLALLAPPRGPRTFFDQFVAYLGLSPASKRSFEQRVLQRFGRTIDSLDIDAFGAQVPLATLVIHDRDDKDVPFAHSQAIARALPNATLVATQKLGHRRILRDPHVIEHTLRFISAPHQQSVAAAE